MKENEIDEKEWLNRINNWKEEWKNFKQSLTKGKFFCIHNYGKPNKDLKPPPFAMKANVKHTNGVVTYERIDKHDIKGFTYDNYTIGQCAKCNKVRFKYWKSYTSGPY